MTCNGSFQAFYVKCSENRRISGKCKWMSARQYCLYSIIIISCRASELPYMQYQISIGSAYGYFDIITSYPTNQNFTKAAFFIKRDILTFQWVWSDTTGCDPVVTVGRAQASRRFELFVASELRVSISAIRIGYATAARKRVVQFFFFLAFSKSSSYLPLVTYSALNHVQRRLTT